MRSAEVTSRQMTEQEQKALDAKLGKPSSPRPKNDKEQAAAAKREAAKPKTAKPKPEPSAKPKPEKAFDLLDVSQKIAKATRIQGAKAVITGKSQRESRIVAPVGDKETTLAFISARRSGLRVHVQDHGSERRETVENVQQAAALVKTSARRTPKKAAPKKAAKSAK